MGLESYLMKLTEAASLQELWTMHLSKMQSYGFDRLLYGYTQFKTETSLGDPDDFVILSNHEPAYLDGFLSGGLYSASPMMGWVLNNEGASSWSSVKRREARGLLSESEQKVLAFNQRMGVTAGYTISFNSNFQRFKGAISLCATPHLSQEDVDAIWAKHGDDIALCNNVAHLKIISLPYSAPKRSLTKRQREVLQWVGDGKTTQDIALILGLTAATVEKHLRLARESLSVETTAQAVLKASFHNQIYALEN